MIVDIRVATNAELETVYGLARNALHLDQFSVDLLGEKIFDNPRPDLVDGRCWVAYRNGAAVGAMQAVARADTGQGWLGVFAVADGHRRQGIARQLFDHVLGFWAEVGATSAEVLAIPGNYFTPGLDPRYTAGLSFIERMGFKRFKDCANMIATLTADLPTADDEARVAGQGIVIRRAVPADEALLDAYFANDFGAEWRMEAALAMRNDPPALHLALRDDAIIAFSAHSTQNREWGFFGPMGTTPACRGLGIGRILLRRCLNDLRAAGHGSAVIPWVGPISFYSQHCGAVVDRVFWRYAIELPRQGS